MIKLRDYQEQGAVDVRSEFREHNAVVYVLATGGGKTYFFCYIADSASRKGKRVMIIVHRKELLLQASKSLRNLGIDHGMISPHFTPAPHKMVQVASVDTLKGRIKKKMVNVDLLIYDEGHHVTSSNKWGKVYEELGKPKTLLVTATPVRGDGIGLGVGHGGIAEAMVIGPPIAELIERGMLINPEVYTSLDMPDLSGLRTNKEGDYNAKQLEERVDKPVITGSAVQHYKDICPGARAVVFCTSVKHAQHVVDEFNAAGYRFSLLVGEPGMSDSERTAAVKGLADGSLDGVCTCDLVSEGFDIPDLSCCIMLRPTQSESLFLQQVGRVMRPSEGKTQAWLLDHVGNVGRHVDGQFKPKHGLPSSPREWTLEGRKKGKKKAADEVITAKQCPKCFHVFEPAPEWFHDPKCPKCSAVMAQKKAVRELEQVDGKLTKVEQDMQVQMQQAAQKRAQQAAAQSVEEMVQKLGYSLPRAQAIVKARQDKAELRDGLIADLRAWHQATGQTPLITFGVAIADVRAMKPAAMKELRTKFDAHRAQFFSLTQKQTDLVDQAAEEF